MAAMSGGVDSSVTAWLLRQQGLPVAGMFMKNWEEDPGGPCPAEQDAEDARAVARLLDIPFHGRNFAAEYWDEVFEIFLSELRAGRTPNPDILCNREIKFKTFLDHARDLGAETIATGHYVRSRRDDQDRVELLKGVDHAKDQSYFLYALNQEQLAAARFPLGELQKHEVRRIAQKAGIPVAQKKDSTGICFIGERDFDGFVASYLKSEPGEIRTPEGKVIGRHRGLIHYTLGQRKGLGIGGVKGYPDAPWFVVHKDMESNVLYAVQGEDHPLLHGTELEASQLTWIAGQPPEAGQRLGAKTRYRQPDQACQIAEIDPSGDRMKLQFDNPQRALTPGQSVVLYAGDRCLGGGIITGSNTPKPAQ